MIFCCKILIEIYFHEICALFLLYIYIIYIYIYKIKKKTKGISHENIFTKHKLSKSLQIVSQITI